MIIEAIYNVIGILAIVFILYKVLKMTDDIKEIRKYLERPININFKIKDENKNES